MKWTNEFPVLYGEDEMHVPCRIEVLPGMYHFTEITFRSEAFCLGQNGYKAKSEFPADIEWLNEDEFASVPPCKLCANISHPGIHSGCDRADNPLCAWHVEKPVKLIREFVKHKLKEGEYHRVEDRDHLNRLYVLKVQEELREVVASDYKDVNEFGDLLYSVIAFAEQNNIRYDELYCIMHQKVVEKGMFTNLVLNNLNPNNPSNALYFQQSKIPASNQSFNMAILLMQDQVHNLTKQLNKAVKPANKKQEAMYATAKESLSKRIAEFNAAIEILKTQNN